MSEGLCVGRAHRGLLIFVVSTALSALSFLCPPLLSAATTAPVSATSPLLLWHGYRGDERSWLEAALRRWRAQGGTPVRALPLPHNALGNKLRAAIPRGNGPDLFIAAHDRAGSWAAAGLLEPIGAWVSAELLRDFFPASIAALTVRGNLFALPLSAKALALYYYPELTGSPPETLSELTAQAKRFQEQGESRWGIGQGAPDSLYFHAPWLHGFGAEVFHRDGSLALAGAGAEASLQLLRRWELEGVSPPELDGALAATYFRERRLAFVVNGPWFRGDLAGAEGWEVAPLPRVDETELAASPFLGVEGIFLSAAPRAALHRRREALALAEHLTSAEEAVELLRVGLLSARRSCYQENTGIAAPLEERERRWRETFLRQFEQSRALSNDPRMGSVWTPMARALSLARRGKQSPAAALAEARQRIEEGWR